MICPTCGKEHDGLFGSGIYCSRSCANTRNHSDKTKEKIGNSLHNRGKDYKCIICGSLFKRGEGYNHSRKFCSENCHCTYFNNITKYVDYNSISAKIQNSRRINKSYYSKEEQLVFNKLKQIFPDIINQYSSKEYPFNCDFYVPSLDLYIEYNKLWTHGGHTFDSSSIDDINKVNCWKSKNTKYYDNAIYTWTDLDIRKQEYVRKNKLNYVILWNMSDVDNYIAKHNN